MVLLIQITPILLQSLMHDHGVNLSHYMKCKPGGDSVKVNVQSKLSVSPKSTHRTYKVLIISLSSAHCSSMSRQN